MTSHKNILYILILYKERKKKTNSSSNTKSNQNIHMPFYPLKIKPNLGLDVIVTYKILRKLMI